METNYNWKEEIKIWLIKKKITNYSDDFISFFELSFKNTSFPELSYFGSNSTSISLLTGNIYFAAYSQKRIWMLLDEEINYLPNCISSKVLSSKKFDKPLYWLETYDLKNLKSIIDDDNIWKSYKNATKLIFQNSVVTAYREKLQHKRRLLDFYNNNIDTDYIYTPDNIVWIKNVSANNDEGAYLGESEESVFFDLHFPNKSGKNINKPQVNEIILLYQKIKDVKVFTHLVTPINNEIVENGSENYRRGRTVKIIAKVDINNLIKVSDTLFKDINISGVTRGNVCRLDNMYSIGDIAKIQFDIWQRFNGYFNKNELKSEKIVDSLINEIGNSLNDSQNSFDSLNGEYEGNLKIITHIARERNRKIVLRKKEEAKKNGSLFCEICGFSFVRNFGLEYIECHHITPISSIKGVVETKLEDLALVCPNCHKMLHMKINNKYLSIEELRKKVEELKL